MSKDTEECIVPDVISDTKSGKSYIRGLFIGKGGFGKCYEIRESKSRNVFAGKIVPKSSKSKNSQCEKIVQEIAIHENLEHKNVVKFYGFFDDMYNTYIILELCKKRSMMELHKRRKTLTECETRYFMKQILEGVHYLHSNRIIHRDLKLENLFLDDELTVKIGDFGLATKLPHDGERKKTLCGTPNYTAPEILTKVGYSYEVDVWSIGCLMYTLLVGKPPFQSSSLRQTYARIKSVNYTIPSHIRTPAFTMISNILQRSPTKRPTVSKLLENSFLTSGFSPQNLPLSCLTLAPRLDMLESYNQRKPLSEMNMDENDQPQRLPSPTRKVKDIEHLSETQKSPMDIRKMLVVLKEQVGSVLVSNPGRQDASSAMENTDPSAQPFVWVSRWLDYSNKYGFGYQLCDDGIGIKFIDGTQLVMLANKFHIHYISHDLTEVYYTVDNYPETLEKKMQLIKSFLEYMNEYLLKTGGSVAIKNSDSMSRIPYMHQWFKTKTAIVMQLNTGSVQINFSDHSKIIMCPLMAAVTYIDQEQNFRTYRFETIQKNGCSIGLARNLAYAHEKLEIMIANSHL